VDDEPPHRLSRGDAAGGHGRDMTTTQPAPAPSTTLPDDPPAVRVRGLVKRYGGRAVVDGVDLDVRRGEVSALPRLEGGVRPAGGRPAGVAPASARGRGTHRTRAGGAGRGGVRADQRRDRPELFIGEATVKTHLLRVFAKLGVDDRTRAVMVAVERGLLPRPGG
jgi:regulatory LuxR family protein